MNIRMASLLAVFCLNCACVPMGSGGGSSPEAGPLDGPEPSFDPERSLVLLDAVREGRAGEAFARDWEEASEVQVVTLSGRCEEDGGCPCSVQDDVYPEDDWECNPETGFGRTCWMMPCGPGGCQEAVSIGSECPLAYGWRCGYQDGVPGCFKREKAGPYTYYGEYGADRLTFDTSTGYFTECWSVGECGGAMPNGQLSDDVFVCHSLPIFVPRHEMGAIAHWDPRGTKWTQYGERRQCEASPLAAANDCSTDFECTGEVSSGPVSKALEEFCQDYCDTMDDCAVPGYDDDRLCEQQCLMQRPSGQCLSALEDILACVESSCNAQACQADFLSLGAACAQ